MTRPYPRIAAWLIELGANPRIDTDHFLHAMKDALALAKDWDSEDDDYNALFFINGAVLAYLKPLV